MTPNTPEVIEQITLANKSGALNENSRIIQALYRATGNQAIFKLDHTLPTSDVVITPENWANLLQELYSI